MRALLTCFVLVTFGCHSEAAGVPREVPELGITIELPADAGVRVLPWQQGHYTTELEIDLPDGRLQLTALGEAKCAAKPATTGRCRDDLKVSCSANTAKNASVCESMKAIAPGKLELRPVPWLEVKALMPANATIVEGTTDSSIPRMANPPPPAAPIRFVNITLGARTLATLSEGPLKNMLSCVDRENAPKVCCAGTDELLTRKICGSVQSDRDDEED